jgi:phosphatidylethanolamine/phosphatidyl-N-methylethanolamine N-methyltransferase
MDFKLNLVERDTKVELQDFYDNYYRRLHYSGKMEKVHNFVHYFIEKNFKSNQHFEVVLELGADLGQHREFVNHSYAHYWQTDIRTDKAKAQFTPPSPNVLIFQQDAESLNTIKDKSVDRIIATCLLAHLSDPEKALNNWRRVIKKGGVISIYVPCEPGFFLRTARFFTTARKSKKIGLNHKSILYREHRNIWILCDLLVREIFSANSISSKRFPFSKLSWNFNLFETYHIKINE